MVIDTLVWIILFAAAGSFLSMAGGFILLWKEKITRKLSLFMISFAAGTLLGVAFLDLLPEALEETGSIEKVALGAVSAIVVFFILERFLWWYHHHRIHADEHPQDSEEHPESPSNPTKAYLLLVGDGLHNFVDGTLIAAAFMTDFSLGVGVAIGVIAHELPQEIADFSVMLHVGFSKTKTLLLNLLAASTTIWGALATFFIFSLISGFTPFIISFAIGIFIYIALSDLIPEIHHSSEHKYDIVHFLLFIGGIVLIGWVI